MVRTQGKVKWFNDLKGFGFISGVEGQDIFVHHTAIQSEGYRSLKEGELVEFDVEPGPKGLKARKMCGGWRSHRCLWPEWLGDWAEGANCEAASLYGDSARDAASAKQRRGRSCDDLRTPKESESYRGGGVE